MWEAADRAAGHQRPEPHLVTVAGHLVKHLRVRPHLCALGDLVRLAGIVSDWDTVVRIGAAGRLGRGVGWALEAARTELGAPAALVRSGGP